VSDPAATARPWSEVFDQVAADYGSVEFFHRFGRALVAFARIGPGAIVVDVACGRGACLLPAIQAADAGGRVIGVDLSAGMLAGLAADLDDRGLPRRLARMDAHGLGLTSSCSDVVLCGLALHLTADPSAVLLEARRILQPGGVVALSVPAGPKLSRLGAYHAVVQRYSRRVRRPRAPDLDVAGLLSAAGFEAVEQHHTEVHLPIPDGPAFLRMERSHGFRAFFDALGPHVARAFEQEATEALEEIRARHGSLWLDRGAVLWRARTSPAPSPTVERRGGA
jgi:O-methyltransferase / aklanonic acid methyltransferase